MIACCVMQCDAVHDSDSILWQWITNHTGSSITLNATRISRTINPPQPSIHHKQSNTSNSSLHNQTMNSFKQSITDIRYKLVANYLNSWQSVCLIISVVFEMWNSNEHCTPAIGYIQGTAKQSLKKWVRWWRWCYCCCYCYLLLFIISVHFEWLRHDDPHNVV